MSPPDKFVIETRYKSGRSEFSKPLPEKQAVAAVNAAGKLCKSVVVTDVIAHFPGDHPLNPG
ncbi:MAG: hypothetical protein ACK559_25565, partial [bacterium]